MTRRYRDGRLVRARRLRRAALQNARNLVLQRVTGMVEAVDRFSLMLDTLNDSRSSAAVIESAGGHVGGASKPSGADDTEPDGLSDGTGRRDAVAGVPHPGRKPAQCAAKPLNLESSQ